MSTEIKTLNGWTDFADRTGRTSIISVKGILWKKTLWITL